MILPGKEMMPPCGKNQELTSNIHSHKIYFKKLYYNNKHIKTETIKSHNVITHSWVSPGHAGVNMREIVQDEI